MCKMKEHGRMKRIEEAGEEKGNVGVNIEYNG